MRHETGRSYARLLVSVYERATVGTSFSVGFVARLSNLERRIHRILRTPRLGSWSSVLSSLAAFTLIVTACATTAPVRHQVPLSGPMVDTSVLPPPNAPAGVGSSAQPVAPPARTSVAAGPARASFETQAPVPGSSPQTRCTLAERRRVEAGGQHIVLWPRQWPVSAGCTLYGEIVAIQLDSVNLLAAVRDTADKDVSAFFVFRTEPGSTTRDVAWATTTGHASLSDTTMSFSINATRPLIMQLQNSTVVGHVSALELKIDEMLMAEMSGVPWELITGLRGAPRCEPMERGEGTADAGNTTERMARTCFLSRGQRFDVPVFRAR